MFLYSTVSNDRDISGITHSEGRLSSKSVVKSSCAKNYSPRTPHLNSSKQRRRPSGCKERVDLQRIASYIVEVI